MRVTKSVCGLLTAMWFVACTPEPCSPEKDVSAWLVIESPREANITPKKNKCGVTTGYTFEIAALPVANVFWKMANEDASVKKGDSVSFSVDMVDVSGVSVSQRIQVETLNPRTEFGYGVPKTGRASITTTTAPLDGLVRSFTVLLPTSGRFVTEVSNFMY